MMRFYEHSNETFDSIKGRELDLQSYYGFSGMTVLYGCYYYVLLSQVFLSLVLLLLNQ
jgi:hypothetical protein